MGGGDEELQMPTASPSVWVHTLRSTLKRKIFTIKVSHIIRHYMRFFRDLLHLVNLREMIKEKEVTAAAEAPKS